MLSEGAQNARCSLWLAPDHVRKPAGRPQVRLFCLPYAGGGASVFRTWQNLLPPAIEVCRVQPPGRENRILEKPHDRLFPLIKQFVDAILEFVAETDFAFYGHSMGTRIAFEAAREIRRRTGRRPMHMFMAACNSPQFLEQPPVHVLPDEQFIEVLRTLGGTPEEVLADADLMELFLPTLRADYALKETYLHRKEPSLDCPVTALGGTLDEETCPAGLAGWREYATSFSLAWFDGGHFFLKSHEERLLALIAETLTGTLEAGAGRTEVTCA